MLHKYYNPAVVVAVLLAVLAPLYFAFKANDDLKSYEVVRLSITPSDPRDLMYGHYLTYQIDWKWKDKIIEQMPAIGDACVCLDEGAINPSATIMACPSKKSTDDLSCKHAVKGSHYGGSGFSSDIERYYVDEKLAKPLEILFNEGKTKFSIGVVFPPNGKAMVEGLYIDDMPLKEYVTLHGKDLPEPPEDAIRP